MTRFEILLIGLIAAVLIITILGLTKSATKKCPLSKGFCSDCWLISDNQIPIDVQLHKENLENTVANRRYIRKKMQSETSFPGCNLESGCSCIAGCQCKSGYCSMSKCI